LPSRVQARIPAKTHARRTAFPACPDLVPHDPPGKYPAEDCPIIDELNPNFGNEVMLLVPSL
jgi:hypothetical protein